MSTVWLVPPPELPVEAAYGYIRVSSFREEKQDEGISPEVQELAITRFAADHKIKLLEIVSDLNVSGGSEKFLRRKILPTIERVRQREHNASAVIVYNLSRWGRSQLESMLSEAELKEAGGLLLSCSEPNDTASAAGEFGRNILHGVSALQRRIIGDSWRAAHDARLRAGLPKDGKPRFGYLYIRDKDGARYIVDPVRGPLLAQAYRSVLAGDTLWSITKRYQAKGVTVLTSHKKTSSTPPIVTYAALQRALHSGFGAGMIISDTKKPVPTWNRGSQDPVIQPEEWEDYKALEFGHEKTRGPQRVSFALRGLVFCGCCKGSMAMFSVGDGQYKLACRTKTRRIATTTTRECSSPVGVRAALVETAVKEWLRAHAHVDPQANRDLVARQLKALEIKADVESLATKLASVRSYKLNLARNQARGGLSDDEYDSLRAEAEAEETELVRVIMEAGRRVRVHLIPPANAFDAVLEAWDRGIADPGMLNATLKQVISGIYVGRGKTASSPDKFDIIAAWEDREPEVFLGSVRGVDHEIGKYCSRCLKYKTASEFYRRKTGKDSGSLSSWCRECQRGYERAKRLNSDRTRGPHK